MKLIKRTYWLPRHTLDKLYAVAARKEQPIQVLVRKALDAYLSRFAE